MGIQALGFIGVKVSNPDAWSTFATDVLGLMKVKSPAGETRLRSRSRHQSTDNLR